MGGRLQVERGAAMRCKAKRRIKHIIPTDEDNSGIPVGAIEYTFQNTGKESIAAIFSYFSRNFMAFDRKGVSTVKPLTNGFILSQTGTKEEPWLQGDFAAVYGRPSNEGELLSIPRFVV